MTNESSEQSSKNAFVIDSSHYSIYDIEESQYRNNFELYNQHLQDEFINNDDPSGYILPPCVLKAVCHILGHSDWSIDDITSFFAPYDGPDDEIELIQE